MFDVSDYKDAKFWEMLRRKESCFDTPEVRRALHKFYGKQKNDRLSKSIREESRCYYGDWLDMYKEYMILEDDMTDSEIEEWIHEKLYIPMVHSIYDCSGRWFTSSYNWRRCKAGIAIVHCVCCDV